MFKQRGIYFKALVSCSAALSLFLSACGGDVKGVAATSAVRSASTPDTSTNPVPAQAAASATVPESASAVAADVTGLIHPAVLPWLDDAGNPIQAHGAGVIQVGKTYYWVGENKANETSTGYFQGLSCYSSTNLQTWHFEGIALPLQTSGDLTSTRIVERPKIIYNASTLQYVMYMHIDNASYTERKVGVATSSTPCGPYTYKGSFLPLGHTSLDMTLFQDSDGLAYLIGEERNVGVQIYKLSSDYLSVVQDNQSTSSPFVATVDGPNEPLKIEAPALFKVNGVYFMLTSFQTGWNLNDGIYWTASSLSGPWTNQGNFAPVGTNTFSSQSAFVLPITGSAGTSYLYLADRWTGPPSVLSSSSYVWLPLSVSGSKLSMPTWYDSFGMDLTTGQFLTGVPQVHYGASSTGVALSGGATISSCTAQCFVMGNKAGYIGGPNNGTLTISNVATATAGAHTLYVRYINNDSTPRYGTVTINGVSTTLTFAPTSTYGVAVAVPFNAVTGSNSISVSRATVANQATSYGPDIEEIYFDNN